MFGSHLSYLSALVKWIIVCQFAMLLSPTIDAQDTTFNAGEVFQQRCETCHTIGKGTRIGPDLKGVTERRDEEWLIKFIRNSQKMIKKGDQTAVKLFNEYNQTVMPANEEYSDKKIKAILSYIEKGGPKTASKQETGTDTLQFPTNRGGDGGGSNLKAVTPNDFIFQMAFWFSLVLIVGVVLSLGYIISRVS